ncbi:acyl carrier protein [Streptomyces sp. NPDC048637]|uniref:acyl carrier protein n=1 Tax=Streptomyces sp. NPDC048637 TaxID=3155636 RepID=UPI003442C096
MNSTIGEITEFLTAALRQGIRPEDDYFALGLADSLFALELVTFVEERFRLTVEVEDLDLESFRTAAGVADFVARKTAGAAAEPVDVHEPAAAQPATPEFATGHDPLR